MDLVINVCLNKGIGNIGCHHILILFCIDCSSDQNWFGQCYWAHCFIALGICMLGASVGTCTCLDPSISLLDKENQAFHSSSALDLCHFFYTKRFEHSSVMQLFHFTSCCSLSTLSKLLESFLKTVGLSELMGLLICKDSQFDIYVAHCSGNDLCHLNQVWLLLVSLSLEVALMQSQNVSRFENSSGSGHSNIVCRQLLLFGSGWIGIIVFFGLSISLFITILQFDFILHFILCFVILFLIL